MKKVFVMLLACTMMLVLAGCTSKSIESSQEEVNETLVIQSLNDKGETVDLKVPYNPDRIAILDMASLDIIDTLGLGDRVVGSTSTSIDYLLNYVPSKENGIADLGTIKTADLVEVAACEPDIIFIGGRLAGVYNELSEIAPVVYLSTDAELGVVESTSKNARTIASIFGMESEIEEKVAGFTARINAIKERYTGKNAVVGIYSGSSLSVVGNDGRCSLIGVEFGFNNMGVEAGGITSTHGNEASWETIVRLDPEYMFVMDRNAAISSTEGNIAASQAIENELMKELDVYKNGNIIYLANPNVWYTAEGGIQALDVMIQDIENELMK